MHELCGCHSTSLTSKPYTCTTRIVCIRHKGRTQCIFPRSQHSCLYVYIHWPKVNLYQVVVGQKSVRTLFKSLAQLFWYFGCPKIALYRISYHFRSIPQFLFLWFFYKMAAGGHFGCPKITFGRISGHFISIQIFYFFYKMAQVGHFGCPKFTFDRISGHFRSIRNFLKFLTKWLTSAIFDVRNSLSIAFLAI